MTVNGTVACVFFLISGGFRISANAPTVMHSAIYAVIVTVSLVLNLIAYRLINIASLTVILSALGLITTSAVGMIIFSEPFEAKILLRIAIMLAATILIFFDGRHSQSRAKAEGGKKFSLGAVAVILAILVASCASTVAVKYFSLDARVTDENSYFFITNVFLVAIGLAVIVFDLIRRPKDAKDALSVLHPSSLASIVGNTVCSNIGSLAGLWLIAQMSVSVYTPISSALGILSGFIASLCFRERVGILSYLAAAGAFVAIII